MKDYRNYKKPYSPKEWEKDENWLAKRLDFIWTLAEYYPALYVEKGFSEEKYNFYDFYPDIINDAQKLNTEQYTKSKYFNLLNNITYEDLKQQFKELEEIRFNNMDSFLRKRLYIKYYFLQQEL